MTTAHDIEPTRPHDKVVTYFQDGEWRNRVEIGEDLSDVFDTKGQAAEQGRRMAMNRGAEHVIHDQDGSVGERNEYPAQADPRARA